MKKASIEDNCPSFRRLTGMEDRATTARKKRAEQLRMWNPDPYPIEMLNGFVVEGKLIPEQNGLRLGITDQHRLCQSIPQRMLVEALLCHATCLLEKGLPIDYTLEQLVTLACERHNLQHINQHPIDKFLISLITRDGRPASRFELGVVEYTGRSGKGNLPATPSRLEPTGLIDLLSPDLAAEYRQWAWDREYVKHHPRPHTPPAPPPFDLDNYDPDKVSPNVVAIHSAGLGAILVPSNDFRQN